MSQSVSFYNSTKVCNSVSNIWFQDIDIKDATKTSMPSFLYGVYFCKLEENLPALSLLFLLSLIWNSVSVYVHIFLPFHLWQCEMGQSKYFFLWILRTSQRWIGDHHLIQVVQTRIIFWTRILHNTLFVFSLVGLFIDHFEWAATIMKNMISWIGPTKFL